MPFLRDTALFVLIYFHHILRSILSSYGDYHTALRFQLVQQGLRDIFRCACNNYAVKGSGLRPAFVAVSDSDLYLVVAQFFQEMGLLLKASLLAVVCVHAKSEEGKRFPAWRRDFCLRS